MCFVKRFMDKPSQEMGGLTPKKLSLAARSVVLFSFYTTSAQLCLIMAAFVAWRKV